MEDKVHALAGVYDACGVDTFLLGTLNVNAVHLNEIYVLFVEH
jgi:hypothetical protein